MATIPNTFTGGTDAIASEVNDNFSFVLAGAQLVGSVYTGTGFENSNHTIQLSTSDLGDANYLLIHVTASFQTEAGNGDSANCQFQIERNETGQVSWSDVLATSTVVISSAGDAGETNRDSQLATMSFVVTLTAGEKSNGIDIKFTGTENTTGSGTATITNKQTFFTGLV